MAEFLENEFNQKLHLCGEMRVHRKGNRELLLFPDFPRWTIVSEGGGKFLRSLDGLSLQEAIQGVDKLGQIFLREMLDCGILILEGLEGDEELLEVETPTGRYYPLQAVWLNVTLGCNLRCKHCFLNSETAKKDELTVEEIDHLMAELAALRGDNPIALDITGGEPLLRRDIQDILAVSRREGISPRLFTNGLLLARELAKELADMGIPVLISLDGASPQTHEEIRGPGTFDKTVEKIRLAVEEGVSVGLSMTVHRGNQHEVCTFLELAKRLGVDWVNFSFLNLLGRAQTHQFTLPNMAETVRLILQAAIKDRAIRSLLVGGLLSKFVETVLLPIRTDCCGTGVNTCAIDSNGDVYPCPSYQIEAFKGGNIREQTFTEIWTSDQAFASFRKLDISTLNPVCAKCELRYFCGGGCRAQAHLGGGGTMQSRNIECKEYKQLYMDLMWLLADHPELEELRTTAGLQVSCR